jgi:hypothetical protein
MSEQSSTESADPCRSMTTREIAALRPLAARVLMHRAGPDAGAAAVAAAARRAGGELAPVLAPLIGVVGIDALAARAMHLAQREYPWLEKTRDLEHREGLFAHIGFSLQQDTAVAADAAAAVLATFAGLLVRLIGEPLAARLLRQAWPDGFSDVATEETGE